MTDQTPGRTLVEALTNPMSTRGARGGNLRRVQREARLKRLILIGSLATFLSFFGLAVASSGLGANDASTQNVTGSVQPSAGSQVTVAAPQIRTSTS